MNENLDKKLCDVAESIFESLAFILPIPEPDSDGAEDAGKAVAKVQFIGAFSGALFLSVPKRMLPMIAANMLGSFDEEPPDPSQEHDALGEFLNVVCGNLLPEVAGSDAVFEVAAPEICPDGQIPEMFLDRLPAAAVSMELEGGMVELVLFTTADVVCETESSASL